MEPAICSFETKDMDELLKFHNDVESVLENLTDETQVILCELYYCLYIFFD